MRDVTPGHRSQVRHATSVLDHCWSAPGRGASLAGVATPITGRAESEVVEEATQSKILFQVAAGTPTTEVPVDKAAAQDDT